MNGYLVAALPVADAIANAVAGASGAGAVVVMVI